MASKNYIVVIVEEPPVVYGPYYLKSAKDFARIGSQHGATRAVANRKTEKTVRVYNGGKRIWPVRLSQLKDLTPGEIPRELR